MNDESIEEGAKAVEEIAKAAGKAIDAGRDAGGWLDKIFGRGIEHAVARRWSDRELTKRIEAAILDWERLELLVQKVERRLRAKGIVQTRLPPPKVVLPLLEHATMEYEDELHTLWANLLATAMEPAEEQTHRKYVSTLAEMTGEDAAVLKALWAKWEVHDKSEEWSWNGPLKYEPGVDAPKNAISMITLNRLGLVDGTRTQIYAYKRNESAKYGDLEGYEEEVIVPGTLEVVVFTPFGEAFCRAIQIGN
jgi:Abortive infection alpha